VKLLAISGQCRLGSGNGASADHLKVWRLGAAQGAGSAELLEPETSGQKPEVFIHEAHEMTRKGSRPPSGPMALTGAEVLRFTQASLLPPPDLTAFVPQWQDLPRAAMRSGVRVVRGLRSVAA
jgi:hypothetical protein